MKRRLVAVGAATILGWLVGESMAVACPCGCGKGGGGGGGVRVMVPRIPSGMLYGTIKPGLPGAGGAVRPGVGGATPGFSVFSGGGGGGGGALAYLMAYGMVPQLPPAYVNTPTTASGYVPPYQPSREPSPRPQTVSMAGVESMASLPVPEPTHRLRYVTLSVSGLKSAADREKLETTLNRLKEVRGVTIKPAGDATTVKVWYSDRDPLASETLLEISVKLGFAAEVMEAN